MMAARELVDCQVRLLAFSYSKRYNRQVIVQPTAQTYYRAEFVPYRFGIPLEFRDGTTSSLCKANNFLFDIAARQFHVCTNAYTVLCAHMSCGDLMNGLPGKSRVRFQKIFF